MPMCFFCKKVENKMVLANLNGFCRTWVCTDNVCREKAKKKYANATNRKDMINQMRAENNAGVI